MQRALTLSLEERLHTLLGPTLKPGVVGRYVLIQMMKGISIIAPDPKESVQRAGTDGAFLMQPLDPLLRGRLQPVSGHDQPDCSRVNGRA